jgi:hypothetical protein
MYVTPGSLVGYYHVNRIPLMGFWEPLHYENTNVRVCLLNYPNSYTEMLKLFL